MGFTFSELDSGAMVCVMISLGMCVAFWVADRRSITTRFLSVFLACIGMSIFINVAFVRAYPPSAMPWLSHLAPIFTGIATISGAEWILRIRRMVPAGDLDTRFGDAQFRVAQFFGLVYALVGVSNNELRAEYFVGVASDLSLLKTSYFWWFGAPFLIFVLALIDGTLMTLRRCPERPEAVRLIGIAVASPLIASGLLLPSPWASYSSALGQLVFLIAAVQYHVLQGQRGQFLKRFLAPSVAELVRRSGLNAAMQQQKLEISVVACDLRGYTQFAEEKDSHEVIAVLHRFYDRVGAAAKAHEATIKDYAGDGVLLLVGAPIACEDHARTALNLANEIRRSVADDFAQDQVPLGIGVGVASGRVSVGVIGQERLEYVAVGRAINLASRLCQHAGAGEILLDESCLPEQDKPAQAVAQPAMELKGISGAVHPWLWGVIPG